MHKPVSFCLILTLLFAALMPTFGQRTLRTLRSEEVVSGDSTKFGDVRAFTDGRGVVVNWKMSAETNNVGFNVYKVSNRGRVQLNNGVIPGSKAHFGDQTAYGERYFFYDVNGRSEDVYNIESLDAANRHIQTGKIEVEFTSDYAGSAGISYERLAAREERQRGQLSNSELSLPREVSKEVLASRFAPDMESQQAVAASGGAKLGIRTDGLYRVTKAELQTVGFPVNSDPTMWQLFCDGVEQSIIVGPNGDYVDFLGRPHETVESDLRYYFLTAGVTPGKRMGTAVSHTVGSTVMSTTYGQTFFAKQRNNYVNDILNGDAENYWGAIVANSPATYNFNLSGVETSGAGASVLVKMQGLSLTSHSVAMTINGQPLPTAIGLGSNAFATSAVIPISALHDGSNTLSMTSSAGSDYSLFDSISITFNRKFVADQNQLTFYTLNYRGARVSGFSSPNVRAFDTTRDGSPVQITNLNVLANGPSYDVVMPPSRGRSVYAVEDSAIKTVPSVIANNPSSLSTTAHNADLVIISYGAFMTQAQAWAQYRALQGFSVEVVDVADVFDEFNFGQSSSSSITAFLQYAVNNWQTPPRYVLLLGDASYDPKNYEGQGYLNLLPTKIVNTVYSETGSDDALVDFNSDGLADLSIGRIPAQTGQVITNAMAKQQAFETPAMQSLSRGAIFADDGHNGYDFAGMSATLRSNLPANIPAFMISRGDANAGATLLNEINNGRYIVNYSGHGSLGVWGGTDFFWSGNVSSLTNANNQSIFTMLTCLNGYFIHPYIDSLSEYLLKAQNGGAVTAWASTGKTTPDVQAIMGNRFYSQIAAGNITRMGDLVRDAKSVIPVGVDVTSVRYSWVLLGDPTLKVR